MADIDRIAPTRQPADRPVMRQQWRDLLFLHWTVPADLLRPLLPAALSLDTFEGQAYIGLVPFTMRNVRPVWSPSVPPLSNFHEINVRTYAHHNGVPGVWFFSLDAANAIAVHIARVWFKLPYYYARMRLDRTPDPAGSAGYSIEYASERLWPAPVPAHAFVNWTPTGDVVPAQPGTLDHFLIERYVLFACKNGQLYSGQVHHTPYPVQAAALHKLDETLAAQAGIAHSDTPPLVHYSRGVDVNIYPLRKIADI